MSTDKDKLIYSVQKKFQTTMIGALARFEESFGYLWENEHKDRQKYEDKWEDTRNHILNNGNRQLRAAINEILDYIETAGPVKQKYHYKFYFDRNKGDNQYEN